MTYETLEVQEPSSRINYTAGITNMAELGETKRWEWEFFDPARAPNFGAQTQYLINP